MPTEAADLSQFANLSEEEKQAVQGLTDRAADDEPAVPQVSTAFSVVLNRDGTWVVVPSVTQPFQSDRTPTVDDIYAGCAIVQKDLAAQETAMHTQRAMLQMSAAMQQQMQEQQIRQNLGNLGNLRG